MMNIYRVNSLICLGLAALVLTAGGCPLDLNYNPTVAVGPDPIACPGTTVTLEAAAEDPNDDPLTYQWTQISGPVTVALVNSTGAEASFSTEVTGDYEFQVTVSDGRGGTDSKTVEVEIKIIAGVCSGYFGVD